ncbi:NAD(P)H-dependent oxidoreductase [Sporanaerobacter acetigenes]|uniref:Predicted homoserine dehydrogenase, contains C-terminal SAF domain n=1 Tax=Sporanaerobacter acetigenes DSM 13106 TaxID=1123281 RepID=A0A1M5YPS1_9FIRM|nr:NAD(P)-dependent oxidoreductase [Sporanaerobacter acetigenes]SHI14016.1 Predicted homoserine dehydrogenase, contains C-terminal SAF domain [Sporanaerobacter acetigenes DSM 13106]
MLGLNTKLAKLEEEGKTIRVGLVGAGQMGKGMVSQMKLMKGMTPSLVVDINLDNAVESFVLAGISKEDIVVAKTLEEVNVAMEQGKYVAAQDSEFAVKANLIDSVVDATGVPDIGAKLAIDSIFNKKHIVMLNVESDVVVGPILNKMARNAGVVYTGTAGDEPGAVKELYDFADAAGFDVLAIGKGKNNPVNLESTPDSVREQALKSGVSPKMLTSFKDGTKTMVEMTCMANATGYIPDVRGGHAPVAKVSELPQVFRLKSEGGILNQYKIVEYVNGIAPGVFIIVTSKLPQVHHEMQYLSMGEGPNYVLYRPYHLTSLETPLTVAKAVLDNEPTIIPMDGKPTAETITIAKKDLKAGEKLDGIGGFTVYGSIETYEISRKENLVPLGLINKNTVMKIDAKKGQPITYDMVELDKTTLIYKLRELQEHVIG